MAAKEIYDYVSTVTPDNDVTLSVEPQNVLVERATKNQIIHLADDGSEERVSLSADSIFWVVLQWNYLNESDAGTLLDFWNSATKGNGRAESFKWSHPTDGHTYVVRFDCDISRALQPASRFSVPEVTLKILGRIAD